MGYRDRPAPYFNLLVQNERYVQVGDDRSARAGHPAFCQKPASEVKFYLSTLWFERVSSKAKIYALAPLQTRLL